MSLQPLVNSYRRMRVIAKQCLRLEPVVPITVNCPLEFFGTAYGGWCIPKDCLSRDSIVVDVGLGEDISFSQSLIERFGCTVHGFDPTPRAIAFVRRTAPTNFVLHDVGLGARAGHASFYLPNDEAHVSGSTIKEAHLGERALQVELITVSQLLELMKSPRIDLLKLDIEGAEYDVIESADFRHQSPRIAMICVEFHHRWERHGGGSTQAAVRTLAQLGFGCAWSSKTTNEEFLFVRT